VTSRTGSPANRGAAAAILILIAAVTLALFLARNSNTPVLLTDEWKAEHQALVRGREHSTRGRVFIEIPIVQSQCAVLDSLSDDLARRLTEAVAQSAVAHAVPRDTAVAVESDAARQDGRKSPTKRLTRANAYVAVMTVLSIRDDSIHAAIVM
jgi:capsular polysaccharide biosynthesis protein